MTLDLPHLVFSKAHTLYDGSAWWTWFRDEGSVLLLVLSALEGFFCVAREYARMPAVLMHNPTLLCARRTWSSVAVVRRAVRMVAKRRYGTRTRALRDRRVPLLSAGNVNVLCPACAAHALCEWAPSAWTRVACERTVMISTIQQSVARLGAWRAVPVTATHTALVFPAVASSLTPLFAQKWIAAPHLLCGALATTFLFLFKKIINK